MENSSSEQQTQNLDLRQYISSLWHWSWLLIVVALIAGAAAYLISDRMRPFYESSTTVLVNEAPATQATDYSSVLMSKQLTSTYAQMMTKDSILEEVIRKVGIVNTIDEVKDWITIGAVRDTQLIQISVTTTNPEYSATIANSIVEVFAAQIQSIQSERFAQSKAALETQLVETNKQITYYSKLVENAATESEKERLDLKLTQYRSIYANLLLSYEQIRLSEAQSVSSVVQVETATPDPEPVSPKKFLNTGMAAVGGFLLALMVVILREALDDSIKTPKEIIRKYHLPVLGVINRYKKEDRLPVSASDPRSPTAEAYRSLRTNVSYTGVDRPVRTILVTSAEPGEGKSTTISNLGVVLAQNGNRVIIADCDMRHPKLHEYFNLPNRLGISSLFVKPDELSNVIQPTAVNGLSLLTTGALPANPAELMGSKAMQNILGLMRQSADVILIDTPPLLAVTDAAALAPSVDGVILVIQPGKTRSSAFQQSLDQLQQVKARVLGVVLNNVVTKGKSYGYHYREYRNYTAYQGYYGTPDKTKKAR